MKKKGMVWLLVGVITASCAMPVYADKKEDKQNTPYLSLGADLNTQEKESVLELLGVSEKDLENYTVATVTNEEEYNYLNSYLDKSVIGSRALSSVLVEGKKAGNGIHVTTKNITYCTSGMYENALATAGIKDADIVVAGPFQISGTAALVGAIKSYENMTGEEVEEENMETATNELVVTGQIAEEVGSQEKAEQLIGAIKGQVVSSDKPTSKEIKEIVDQAAKEMEVKLSEEDRQAIVKLMEKIDNLDLDINSLKEQAKNLYNKIEDLGLKLDIDKEQVKGFLDKIIEFVRNLFSGN